MSSGFTKLEVVFRDATDPILIKDLDGIVIDVNEQAVPTRLAAPNATVRAQIQCARPA
jgi:hypothetical protein